MKPLFAVVFPIAGAWVLTLASPARAELVDRVAAVVNTDVIALSEVQQRAAAELSQLPSGGDGDARAKAKTEILREALDLLIGEKLLEADGQSLQITVTDAEVSTAIADVRSQNNLSEEQFERELRGAGYSPESYKAFMKKQLGRLKLLQQRVRSKVKVADEDLKAEYVRYSKLESEEVELKARHIIVALTPNASSEQVEAAKRKADALAQEARTPKVDFAALAKKKSEGPSAAEGGDLGTFRRGTMMEEFERVAFALKEGEISAPVRTRFGFHIILVEKRLPIGVASFEEMKAKLSDKLLREQMERLTQQHIQQLRAQAVVDVKL
ncbi:MAG: peptidylprolyl isomerase [Myxococcaceae bacterium]